MEIWEAEGGAEFVVAEGGAEAEGDEGFCVLAGRLGDGSFAFGADFVAGWVGALVARRRGFRGEDYTFRAAIGCSVAVGWGFDAEAEEHFAEAEVGLGSVVEGVLFAEAEMTGGA